MDVIKRLEVRSKSEMMIRVRAELAVSRERMGDRRILHHIPMPTTVSGAEYAADLILILLAEGQNVCIDYQGR